MGTLDFPSGCINCLINSFGLLWKYLILVIILKVMLEKFSVDRDLKYMQITLLYQLKARNMKSLNEGYLWHSMHYRNN